MGLFSFVGGLIGAGSQKKASRKAEAAAIAGLQKGIDRVGAQFDETKGLLAPYSDIGTQALGPLGDLIGIGGPEKQAMALAALKDSPAFQTLYDTGQEALLQTGAATGGLRGGNMARGLADFGADTFARVIQDQIGRLGGLSSMGYGAATQTGNFGADAAAQIASMFGGQGKARADGLLTRGGITAGMWNSAGGMLDSLASSFIGGMGGGGGIKGGLNSVLKGLF